MASRTGASSLMLFFLVLFTAQAAAQGTVYYFTGAIYVYGNQNPSSAVPAQCPSDHPVSCSAISEAGYCCPSNNYCSWNNNQVACCPNGQTCTGAIGGGGGYTPTTWYPTTTWYPATTTVVNGGGGGVVYPAGYTTTVYTEPEHATTTNYIIGGYCSTLYAKGPGLPTTRQGDCGTILVEEAAAAQWAMGWMKMVGLVLGLQVFGWLLLFWR